MPCGAHPLVDLLCYSLASESVIRNRRRNLGDLSPLLDFKEINMNTNNVQGPPPAGLLPQNHNGPPELNLQMPALGLRTMEELCQPTMNERGGPIDPVNIQATDFGLKNHMIQQVQNSCQFHGLPGDDANKHLEKFLTVTHSMNQNEVTDDALHLYLFPYYLTHHATAWFDRLPKNSIHTFREMALKFLSKYFPPSMVRKLRNDISNFRQLPDESLFEVWQPEECYDLIENMTAHHNDWDTSTLKGGGTRPGDDHGPGTSRKYHTSPTSGCPVISRFLSFELPTSPTSRPSELPKKNPHQPPILYPLSLVDALALMPKYGKMLKDLLFDKEKLLGLTNTSLTENCSAVLLKKLHEKHRDPGKFLISCDFPELEKCMALADLANQSVAYLAGIAEDVCIQVDKFIFPVDFVVVDYDVDPRVPFILGRPVTPLDGAWTEYVSGGMTLLRISSTKHKERPLKGSKLKCGSLNQFNNGI
nr:hypothetical protein [Tanacetum cinerariifolium]